MEGMVKQMQPVTKCNQEGVRVENVSGNEELMFRPMQKVHFLVTVNPVPEVSWSRTFSKIELRLQEWEGGGRGGKETKGRAIDNLLYSV